MHPILKQLDGEIPKEQTMNVSDANDQPPMLNIVDSDRLLFSVFSLLQKLGADERPEVGNMSFKSIFLVHSLRVVSQFGIWWCNKLLYFSQIYKNFGICFGLHLHCFGNFCFLMT